MTFLDERGRVSAFLSNGGGTITFRIALTVVAAVALWLLQSFGTHIVGQLDDLARAQSRMATSLATQIQQGADTAGLSARNSDRLDDHEHRITVLEARAPDEAPMTLRLTPNMPAAGYDFLRTSQPFAGWKLPHSDEVGFHVVADPKIYADFAIENGVPLIRVSAARNGHAATLLATLAHEMIHLRQALTGDRGHHNAAFRKMAARVCKVHGFDSKTF